MNPFIQIIVILILFTIFWPMIFGKKWQIKYKIGYQYGTIGATAVVIVVALISYFKPF